MEDEDIIGTADDWTRQQEETKRHAAELTHKRWKWFFLILVLSALGTALWFLAPHLDAWLSERQARKQDAAIQAEKDQEFREKAWVECVETMGLRKCKAIKELTVLPCLDRDPSTIKECLRNQL